MADKTTTLTTQTGDSIYPNVLDENIPDTIARVSDVNKLKTDVETAYLTKANAEATYQTKTGRTDYVSKTYGDGTYATITQLGGKQDKLMAGSNITIDGTTIAAVRPENMALYGDLVATDGEFTGGGSGGATGGGGVSPTLNLLDLSGDDFTVRTTITQAEKDNLDKGLYNQILYSPSTDQRYDLYAPSKLLYDGFDYRFAQFDIDTSSDISIKNASLYTLKIGKKDADGNYPITVEKYAGVKVGGDSVSPKLITSTEDYAELTDTDYFISINITKDSSVAKKGTYILSGNKANGYSYWYPENKSKDTNMEVYWHYIHYDSTGLSAVGFSSHLDIGKNNQSGFGFEGQFPNSGALFGGFTVEQVPLFSKYTLVSNAVDPTPILPCTASDNGKVLSVVNGEAQWAKGFEYDTITIDENRESYTGTITGDKPVYDTTSHGFLQGVLGIGIGVSTGVGIESSEHGSNDVYSLVQNIFNQNTVSHRVYYIQPRTYSHFITLSSNTLGNINFNYYDIREESHTIDTLKTALKGRTVSCSGYINNGGTKEIATYIEGASNGSLSVGWFNISDGSTGRTTLDTTITISDTVKPVE